MSKAITQLTFNVIIVIVIAAALYFSQDWPRETALFPQAIGLPTLALCVVSLIMAVYQFVKKLSEPDGAEADDGALPAKAGIVFAWLIGFALAIWVLGFYLAAFVFVFLYMKYAGGIKFIVSLGYSVATSLAVYFLFGVILKTELYPGLLWDFLKS